MAKISGGLDVIQSYVLTSAKYSFSVYEKRVLYQLVNIAQKDMEGKKLDKNYEISTNLFNEKTIKMPTSAFLKGEGDRNYRKVRDALMTLRSKTIEYDYHDEDTGEDMWKAIGIIEKPRVYKNKGIVEFEVVKEIWSAILNFSKGFNKFELVTAMKFKSVFSMRFYELFAYNMNPMTLTIEQLKARFKLENKYAQTGDFIKNVIDKAKAELDDCSPVSFNYTLNKKGRKTISINFIPCERSNNMTEESVKAKLQGKISLHWDLDITTVRYLKDLGFTEKGIRSNFDNIKLLNDNLDIMNFLAQLRRKAEGKNNKQAYIMGAIKTRAKQIREIKNYENN